MFFIAWKLSCFLINLLCWGWGAPHWKKEEEEKNCETANNPPCNRFQNKLQQIPMQIPQNTSKGKLISMSWVFWSAACVLTNDEKLHCWGSTRVILRGVSNFFFSSSCVVLTLLFVSTLSSLFSKLSANDVPPFLFKTLLPNWKTESLQSLRLKLIFLWLQKIPSSLVLCKAPSQGGGKLIKTEDSF